MIRLDQSADINWDNLQAVAYEGAHLELGPVLLDQVDKGRRTFLRLIEQGVPCYGVTTGLGRLVNVELDERAKTELARNILLARAVAVGEPLPREVVRATLMIKLVNFLSGQDGVSPDLCQFIVARLNDGFTPRIPRLGHGMGGDAVAHSHCFQTLVGEGSVLDEDGQCVVALDALRRRNVAPYEPQDKEGLALISGVGASIGYAIHAHRAVSRWSDLAILVAATAMEALAAPHDSVDPELMSVSMRRGPRQVIQILSRYLRGSEVEIFKLQAPVSFRVIPQVHGALIDTLDKCREEIAQSFSVFTDNPVMVKSNLALGHRLLSFGGFHDQHLINHIEHLTLALMHAGALGERRLHRLMDPYQTGLNAQLAARPGLDAGLVTVHKACVELMARAKILCMPSSLFTAETSAGQEDYMSLIFPALDRLLELVDLLTTTLCYELLATVTAIDLRGQQPAPVTAKIVALVREYIPRADRDRSPGPGVEVIRSIMDDGRFDDIVCT